VSHLDERQLALSHPDLAKESVGVVKDREALRFFDGEAISLEVSLHPLERIFSVRCVRCEGGGGENHSRSPVGSMSSKKDTSVACTTNLQRIRLDDEETGGITSETMHAGGIKVSGMGCIPTI
jgi:hypothetical protein